MYLYKKTLLLLALLGLVLGTYNCPAQEVWYEHTFEDFVDGSFDDNGANMYVSHKGRVQPINRWDVNNDGYIDILCVNSHPLVEMLDLSIYWGNGKDYSIQNHTYIPANGPMWITPDDLDNDGNMDLVVANYSNGTWTDMESFVYYGGLSADYKAGDDEWAYYPFRKRIMLPGSNTQKAAVADLNKDGYKDIIFAFSGGFWEYRDKSKEGSSPSRIYWGSRSGFDPENFKNIWTNAATDVYCADLNEDGWTDLVFANGDGPVSYIYLGSQDGIKDDVSYTLPTNSAHAVKCGDVNNDGFQDVIFACSKGFSSYAYLNQNGKFDPMVRVEFETYMAKDVVLSDFNRDGKTDVFFTNHQHSLTGDPKQANRLISSYLYYGSDAGFLEQNRLELPTIGAWGANASDFNEDGWVDLLVSNFQEHYSYEVPSFIYWNSESGFSLTHRTPLYEHGAQGNAVTDLNGDGHLDIIIASMMGNSRGDYDPSFLYLGSADANYSAQNRIELPGREPYEQAFADLDDDGQTDILLLNRGEVTREANELWIYWNETNHFSPWKITGLPSHAGLGVEVADLDRNGYLDIIISNGKPEPGQESGSTNPGSFIYWGGPEGWPVTERTALPVVQTRATAICDMNQDGHLDLIFGQQGKWGEASIFWGNGARDFTSEKRIRIKGSEGSGTPGIADLNKDGLLDIAFAHDKNVLVYYQVAGDEFALSKPEKISVQAKTMCIADVNDDGWLDLVCPFYKGNGRRSAHSTVLLGSENGYTLERSQKFPTDGATGSIVTDFNTDGYTDIFFFCHRSDGSFDKIGKFGDHHTNSLLYWGSKDGFKEANRLAIPSIGVHYDTGIDVGHIRDRSSLYEYISSPYQSDGKKPVKIDWGVEPQNQSSIRFQIRTARSLNELEFSKWQGADKSEYISSPMNLSNIQGDTYIQYKVTFDTGNGAHAPVLRAVKIVLE